MKLQAKKRIKSRIIKKYDVPQTPYERLLAAPQLSEAKKRELRQRAEQLNPFVLKKEIDRKLKIIFDRLR